MINFGIILPAKQKFILPLSNINLQVRFCLYRMAKNTFNMQSLSCVQLFATLCTVACQAPLSKRFSRQEYWSGFPSPGDLPDPGIEPRSPALIDAPLY